MPQLAPPPLRTTQTAQLPRYKLPATPQRLLWRGR